MLEDAGNLPYLNQYLLIISTMEFLAANFCGQILSTFSMQRSRAVILDRMPGIALDRLHWLLQLTQPVEGCPYLKDKPLLDYHQRISRQGDFSVSRWQPRLMQFASAPIQIRVWPYCTWNSSNKRQASSYCSSRLMRGSSRGKALDFRLDGPGSIQGVGSVEIFLHSFLSTQPPIKWVPEPSPGGKGGLCLVP